MPRQLKSETVLFLECLAEASVSALGLLMSPSIGRFLSSYDWEENSMERKLQRLAERGVISLPDPTDPRIVRITETGRTLASHGVDPEARWNRPWDGLWRMVLFDVPEADRPARQRLRRELKRTRLGYLQGSVWITPDPLDELRRIVASTKAVPESLLFFEGHASAGESDKSIVNGAWDMDAINQGYRAALDLQRAMPRNDAPPHRWRQWLAEEHHAWMDALAADPLLPESLLPKSYLGRTALASHRKAMRIAATHVFAHKPEHASTQTPPPRTNK